jgi:hypothetical protein
MISALGWNFVPIVLVTQAELFTKRENIGTPRALIASILQREKGNQCVSDVCAI